MNKHLHNSIVSKRLKDLALDEINRYLFVDTSKQKLLLIENSVILSSYPVSTSKSGIGSKQGSFKTPQGIHRVCSKIGNDAPIYRIFKSRKDTDKNWNGTLTKNNLILTRILRLEGLENGINRGEGIDSFKRYIYIHGTNREDKIGTPFSHGCVCMKNEDIIDLFNKTAEGTIVIIN